MTTNTKPKRVTLATVKAFVRRNKGSLYIKAEASFDGMTDCVQRTDGAVFRKITKPIDIEAHGNTFGISGAWFVKGGGDYFRPYDKEGFKGHYVYNCCGRFTLAIQAD